MKTKLIAFLILGFLGLAILVAEGFSATAKQKLKKRHISEDVRIDAPGYKSYIPSTKAVSKYLPAGLRNNADCFDIHPDGGIDPVVEHDQVGTTWYDFQKNGSMGRMISVTGPGTGINDGMRHVSWMWSPGSYQENPRGVLAWSKPWGGVWTDSAMVGNPAINSGYCNQTHLNDGTSVVVFHSTADLGGLWSTLAIDDFVGAGVYTRLWDLPDSIVEVPSGEMGGWPKASVMYCLDETIWPSALNYIHIIESESIVNPGRNQEIAYLRCYIKPDQPAPWDTLVCQTPTEPAYYIKANEEFQADVHSFDHSCDISAVIVTGRGIVGRKVAIAYMPNAVEGDCDYLSDVGYIECQDNGDAWIDGTDWPPTINNITNYGTGDNERAFHDLSACYDYDDSLHIVFVACGFDPYEPGYYRPGIAYLYHWCKEQHWISMIASKIQEYANPPAYNVNIGKPSISAMDPVFCQDDPLDTNLLYCIWAQVDSSDQNAAGDQGNGDIFGSSSFDGGWTWGRIYNLTGTHTPGCMPGDCVSEHWPSLAQNIYDGDLHIEYICDKDAGAAIMDEGEWTENEVVYMRLLAWYFGPPPSCYFYPEDPSHWFHPPLKVEPGQQRTIFLKGYDLGNQSCTYNITSDHPCIQVNVSGELQPKDSVLVPVILDGTGACDGTFISGNVIVTTYGSGREAEYMRVHAVAAHDYYECPKDPETVDTLDNGVLELRMNANGEMEIDDMGTRPDTTFEVFLTGGTIVATTSGSDTVVGRCMLEDQRAGARDKLYTEECNVDWEPDFWIVYTKDSYICPNHLNPPSHFKWFWWELSKHVKLFKEDAPEVYKHIVIQYVRVKRHDPPGWWPDQTPFVNYEDTYIGVACDIDCPYDSSAEGGGPEPYLGDEWSCNLGGYDDVNHIAYQIGFGRGGEHPEYGNYHCGIALADGGMPGESIVPYGSHCVKNNQYVYPNHGWGWKDGELYQLASTSGNTIQDPDSIVDRSYVFTARKIDAGTDPDAEAAFTVIHVLAPNGLAELQMFVDSARAIVEREKVLGGLPAICGDCNGDGNEDIGDLVCKINYLFRGNPPLTCPMAKLDVNGDGVINVGDIVYEVSFLYRGGPEPECPGIWY